MAKFTLRLGLSVIMFGGLSQVCFCEHEHAQEYLRGVQAIDNIIKARNSFKDAVNTIVKDGDDVADQKKRLELIVKEMGIALPTSDGDLQKQIEKVIQRIQYLEQEKIYRETNYWQINKAFVVFAVITGIALNVGFWLLMRYFLNEMEEVSRMEDENRKKISNLSFVATEFFGGRGQP